MKRFAMSAAVMLVFAVSAVFAGDEIAIKIGERGETEFEFEFAAKNDTMNYLLMVRLQDDDPAELDSGTVYSPDTSLAGDDIDDSFPVWYGKTPAKVSISNAERNSLYRVDVFEHSEDIYTKVFTSDSIATLAEEPRRQGDNVMFYRVKKDGMWVLSKGGTGEQHIIIMSKAGNPIRGTDPKPPKDGTYINPAITGADSTWQDIGNNTWVIYNSYQNPKKECIVTGLEPATRYWFYSIDYNGVGENANYLHLNGLQNPRLKYTLAAPPEMKPVSEKTSKSFKIAWEPMEDVVSYVIDIAYDENFEDPVDIFNKLDVEKNTELLIELQDPVQPVYYIRVMAYLEGTPTPWCETVEVEMNL